MRRDIKRRRAYAHIQRRDATPSGKAHFIRSAFLGKIKEDMQFTRPVDSEDALRVVWRVLAKHVGEGQATKIFEALPAEIRRVAEPRENVH